MVSVDITKSFCLFVHGIDATYVHSVARIDRPKATLMVYLNRRFVFENLNGLSSRLHSDSVGRILNVSPFTCDRFEKFLSFNFFSLSKLVCGLLFILFTFKIAA